MTETELVTGCRNGDRNAQHELYARTSQRIYRLLERMTGDADAAFDLAQETYLRAFTRIAQFDGRSAIATWLYRIAVTEALQYLRRERRQRAQRTEEAGAAMGAAELNVVSSLDLREALASLDPLDRTVLLLRYQAGLDYRAIAEALACAPGTVGSRLNRARARLREILGEDYGSREGARGPAHLKGRAPGRTGPGWST